MDFVQSLKQSQVRYIVYPTEIENMSFIKTLQKEGFQCFSAIDPRSALYIATGIAAQNQEFVICIVSSSNASRSVFSGMTEAYYRKLPIVLVTIGTELDYSIELGDVVQNHFIVSEQDDLREILKKECPIHLELQTNLFEFSKTECSELQKGLGQILSEEHYLLIGPGIDRIKMNFKCKTVASGMPNCSEGSLANVLGASLAHIRRRYIGLVSENEFIHDMNTLGNINMNDLVLYIVVVNSLNQTIEDYAHSLNFETLNIKQEDDSCASLMNAVNSQKKTVLQYVRGQ